MTMEQVAMAYYMWMWCLFLALLLPLLLLELKKKLNNNGAGHRLPPGPRKLPIIGNVHLLIRSRLAHRAMAELARRHDAPLMHLKLGEVDVVVASSAGAAREIMRTHDVAFASRPWSPSVRPVYASGAVGIAFAPYGTMWRQLRKICVSELLSARRVQSFRKVREDEVGRLVAAVAASPPGEAVNVSEGIAALIADSAVRAIIGDRFERREEFLHALDEGFKAISGFGLGDLFPSWRLASLVGSSARRVQAINRKMSELMDSAIRQHHERRSATADGGAAMEDANLVDVLLRIQKEGGLEVPLTMQNIKSVIVDLFSGGSETSATTLQWAMLELMRNPGVMSKAQAEVRGILDDGKPTVTEDDLAGLRYLRFVIKETLRLHPVVPLLLPRECRETCKVMGYDVLKGTTVFVNVWAIGRDPRYWDDAETFKPERFENGTIDFKGMDFEFIPFGAGRRMCPGATFALASMEIVLATLLYHFDWELPAGMAPSQLDTTEKMSMALQMKNDLYLCPIVRVPLHAAP